MKLKDAIVFLVHKIRDIYPKKEAQSIAYLVLEHLGFTKRDLILNADLDMDPVLFSSLDTIGNDLKTNRPVQQVLGYADFYGLKFLVNEYVLIPRSETEELVDLIIKENSFNNPWIMDIGTGSGCIAISLAKNISGSVVSATDISEESIKTAKENALRNDVNINFIVDDIFNTGISLEPNYNILVCNPPYVTESEKKLLHKNVLSYEPGLALFVHDDDPLRFYRRIAEVGMSLLKNGSRLYVEINERYGGEVAKLFLIHGLRDVNIIKDMHNKERIVKALRWF